MKFADRLKEVASTSAAGVIDLSGASAGFRTLAKAITAGALAAGDTGVCFCVEDSTGQWEEGLYTITSATQITRTSLLASSNDGAAVTTWGVGMTAFCTVPASYLSGQSLADYVNANAGGVVAQTDNVVGVRGSSIFSFAISSIAQAVKSLWTGFPEVQVQVSNTNALPLDFSVHNGRRLICTAAPNPISGPVNASDFGRVGNNFSCRIENLSGSAISLTNITVRPSGSTIPAGSTADVFAANGTVYANVSNTTGTASAATEAIFIDTISSPKTVGTPYNVTGTWTGVQPSGLNYAIADNGGALGQYNTPQAQQINANGTWQITVNPATASASRTMVVQDSAHTTIASSPSNPYVVNSAAGGGTGASSATAPFTVTARGGAAPYGACAVALRTFDGDYFNRSITPTGTATIVSVNSALFESNTVVPTSTVDPNSAAGSRGVWLGSTVNYANQGSWLNVGGGGEQGLNGVSADYPTEVDFYLWTFVTDSNGITWKFVSTFTINVMNGNSKVLLAADSVLTAVA